MPKKNDDPRHTQHGGEDDRPVRVVFAAASEEPEDRPVRVVYAVFPKKPEEPLSE